jgi:hypothetical protein
MAVLKTELKRYLPGKNPLPLLLIVEMVTIIITSHKSQISRSNRLRDAMFHCQTSNAKSQKPYGND